MTKLKSLQSPNRLAVNHAAEIEDLAAKSLKFRSQKLHVKPANVTEDVEQVKIFDVFNKNKFQAAASPSASRQNTGNIEAECGGGRVCGK
jgi:hypothetical protein